MSCAPRSLHAVRTPSACALLMAGPGLLFSSPLPDARGNSPSAHTPGVVAKDISAQTLVAQKASGAPSPATAAPSLRTLQGTIGKNSRFRMVLRPGPGSVEGFYIYEKYGVPILLKGTLAPDGHLRLTELDGKGRPAATVDGVLNEKGLEGTWSTVKGDKTLPLQASLNKPFARDLPSLTGGFSGTLGDKIRFRAQLTGEGGKLEGFYRYPKSSEDLQLSGRLEADGAFSLEEHNARGEVTGRWRGYFLTPSLAAGDWSSADGNKRLPLLLREGGPLEKIIDLGGGMKLIPNDASYQGTLCDLSVSWPQLRGHQNPAAQAQLNKSWTQPRPTAKDCMKPEPGQTWEFSQSSGFSVTAVRDGFLGLSFGSAEYSGGAHGNWGSVCKLYDLGSGAEVDLSKRLKPDGLARLSALVDRNFKKEFAVQDLAEAGFFQSSIVLTTMPSICLQAQGFSVQFTPYELAPYAMGAPETAITAAEAAAFFVSDAQTRALFAPAK